MGVDPVRGHGDSAPWTPFQEQVHLWLEVWAADAPELREQARAAADPTTNPWGYLAALGDLVATQP